MPHIPAWRLIELLDETPWTRTFRASAHVSSSLRRPEWEHTEEGSFAVVLARDDLPRTFDRELAHGLLVREAEVSHEVRHAHLVATLSVQREADRVYLVQPYLAGTSLAEQPASAVTPRKLWAVRQAAEALTALHDTGWLHGNVTPRSISVGPQGHATLMELGFGRRLGSEECDVALTRFAGTLRYAAPEMFDDQGEITAAADVYSLGAVLLEQLSGATFLGDYEGPELVAAKRLLSRTDVRSGIDFGPLAVVVSQMLAREPLRRPPARSVVESLVAAEVETFGRWAA